MIKCLSLINTSIPEEIIGRNSEVDMGEGHG
jgi:hypothetical protein